MTIAPQKSALVIIDMQNFILSPAMGREQGPGHQAKYVLLSQAIPAARRSGIRILWLSWGSSDEGLKKLPPMFYRNFGMSFLPPKNTNIPAEKTRQEWRLERGGIGCDIGTVKLDNGTEIKAGRSLMKDQWNTELHDKLADAYKEGAQLSPPDVKFNKESHSGFWGGNTEFAGYLRHNDIKTLLFAGVNTDQCVLATLQDAVQQGYDAIMIKDACGTVSPHFAQEMVDFNAEKAFGFQSTSKNLLHDAERVEYESTVGEGQKSEL